MTHPLSASQIQSFVDCNRKWAFLYLEKVPSVRSPAAELGTRTHEILAKYLESGLPPDPNTREGKIALAGIKYLTTPGIAQVEQFFTFDTGVASYRGYVDFQYQEDGATVIGDHKTTSGFFFAKTAHDLLTDIQSTIYAKYAFLKHACEKVKLKWVYYSTGTQPKSKLVEVEFPASQLEVAFAPIEAAATEMQALYEKNPGAMEVKPNFGACDKFGGCQFKNKCLRGT